MTPGTRRLADEVFWKLMVPGIFQAPRFLTVEQFLATTKQADENQHPIQPRPKGRGRKAHRSTCR